MRVPFLRNSPAARSTSKTPKRKVFLAGLLAGIDTAAGSLASALIRPGRRYNTFVSAASPPSQPDHPAAKRRPKLDIHKFEAGGILIIGALILLATLTRYWHHIAWGAR